MQQGTSSRLELYVYFFGFRRTVYSVDIFHVLFAYRHMLQSQMMYAMPINPSHKYHNALDEYPTMSHFVTEICTRAQIKGYGTGVLHDLWE